MSILLEKLFRISNKHELQRMTNALNQNKFGSGRMATNSML
jgi:hypothetical protein